MNAPSITNVVTLVVSTGLTYVAAHQFSSPWVPAVATLVGALWHLYAPSPTTQDRPNPWKAPEQPKP